MAAICPAAAGLGKWVKSMGTTKKPKAVKLPHHKAASIKPKRMIYKYITAMISKRFRPPGA